MRRSFKRSYDSLGEVFAFVRDCLVREQIEAGSLFVFCFAAEELFTNMVKYSPGADEIQIEVTKAGDELLMTLYDSDVDEFDVTQVPPAQVEAPIQDRQPGGLGIHLVRKLTDRVEYEYSNRQSRITVGKKLGQEQC